MGERVSAAAALTRGRPHGGRGPEDPAAPALRKTRPRPPRPGALVWLPFAAGGVPGHPWRGQRGQRGCGGPSSPYRALAFPQPGTPPGGDTDPGVRRGPAAGAGGDRRCPRPGDRCLPGLLPAAAEPRPVPTPRQGGTSNGRHRFPLLRGGRTDKGGTPRAPGGTRVGRVSAGRALLPPPLLAEVKPGGAHGRRREISTPRLPWAASPTPPTPRPRDPPRPADFARRARPVRRSRAGGGSPPRPPGPRRAASRGVFR